MQTILKEISAAIGLADTIELTRRWGGRTLAVPMKVDVIHPLAMTLGLETAQKLVKHFGGESKVKEMSEMVKRAFLAKAASPEAFEKTGLALVESAITRNPDLAIPFMEMIAPYAQEGGTHVGDGGTKATGPTPIEKQLPKTGKALGW